MSYQIKRTPYFQRMFNNSKRNGQLQRLREEYERIQEFNDRTIDMKMRQVRLKRLFREIEDINETPGGSNNEYRRHQPLVPMSPEAAQAQQRRERLIALERARELGQEISRRNAALADTGSGYYLRSELRLTAKMRAVDDMRRQALERRQRAARRLSYGNAQSRSNMERIVRGRQRRQVTVNSPAASFILDTRNQVAQITQLSQLSQNNPLSQLSQMTGQMLNTNSIQTRTQGQLQADLNKRAAMLQQRLQYGNSQSSNNMIRSQIAAAQRVMSCMVVSDTLTEDEELMQQRQLQLHLECQRQKPILDIAQFTTDSSISDNTKHVQNDNDSDVEMETALQPPTESDTLHPDDVNDDDVPSTSQHALKVANDNNQLSAYQPHTIAHLSQESKSDRASERWHRISLTLPWFKVINNHPMTSNELTPRQMANISISIGSDEPNNSGTGTPPTTDNYHSFRGPSMLQEDLMQIMELDDGGQVPTMRLPSNTLYEWMHGLDTMFSFLLSNKPNNYKLGNGNKNCIVTATPLEINASTN